MKKYYIYRATNTLTNESYVGVTRNGIEKRKRNHIQKANNGTGHQFQEAIATYGPDAFDWEQIDTASSPNELAIKERQYISKYDSKENGYNSDYGGGIKKKVYQYDLKTGKLVNTFDSLSDAASSFVGVTNKQLSRACLSVSNLCKGYYWSYRLQEPFKPGLDDRKKEVYKLDSAGSIVAKYTSISLASIETGINKSSIAKVCRGERNQAGGFRWRYV
ncbi:GIY-YIG nuclease family protein [Mangrovimonas sp. ST2L15]|uniref:GIY-YIG nuclease family protein n=1 Tax=Mangrovimonas sp. ST2L15 TaxID=1645916 RepID=UPI0006B53BB7|nr:GIY-YIG nuclease family protein [Mangrovimonas sp. ST2L15]